MPLCRLTDPKQAKDSVLSAVEPAKLPDDGFLESVVNNSLPSRQCSILGSPQSCQCHHPCHHPPVVELPPPPQPDGISASTQSGSETWIVIFLICLSYIFNPPIIWFNGNLTKIKPPSPDKELFETWRIQRDKGNLGKWRF